MLLFVAKEVKADFNLVALHWMIHVTQRSWWYEFQVILIFCFLQRLLLHISVAEATDNSFNLNLNHRISKRFSLFGDFTRACSHWRGDLHINIACDRFKQTWRVFRYYCYCWNSSCLLRRYVLLSVRKIASAHNKELLGLRVLRRLLIVPQNLAD